jgi:hypothetical protein
MSLLGGINTYYQTSDDTNVVALRDAVGAGFFADYMPDEENYPYAVLIEQGRSVTDLTKGCTSWVEKVTVVFAVYGQSREQVEAIFLPGPNAAAMRMSNRQLMGIYPGDRSQAIVEQTNGDAWQGTLELGFQLQRGTT